MSSDLDKGFPAAWLEPVHDQFVFERAQWNLEPAPPDAVEGEELSVNWPHASSAYHFLPKFRGVAIGPTIIRLYFGLTGCIIPVADVPILETATMVFTIAGPADAEGKKEFYVYVHDHDKLSAIQLYRLPAFKSIADMYRNCCVEPWGTVCVPPVAGGEEVTTKELIRCGYLSSETPSKPKKPKKPKKNAFDWADYFAREKAGEVL
ncbi:hypothetical protein K438DRAFT_1814414 [Mycena galopus ATCC 62051]|nr:hypothetical protein K438DRAFT_1814414 [Mycena galopus ATCC 62051]